MQKQAWVSQVFICACIELPLNRGFIQLRLACSPSGLPTLGETRIAELRPAILFDVLTTVAISGYRSLRDLVLPLDRLNVVTGANGSGKSSLYRALRLLGEAALNSVVSSLAREGGLPSTLWAGPETIARDVRQGDYRVEGTAASKPASLKLGFGGDTYGYSIDLGYPPPPPPATAFDLDPGGTLQMKARNFFSCTST
jgi:predicted ATPase